MRVPRFKKISSLEKTVLLTEGSTVFVRTFPQQGSPLENNTVSNQERIIVHAKTKRLPSGTTFGMYRSESSNQYTTIMESPNTLTGIELPDPLTNRQFVITTYDK